MMQRFFVWILSASLLVGCAGPTSVSGPGSRGLVVSAAYGPDGRLWRVTSGGRHVYVDHSDDDGHSFSPPVVLNPAPQPIRATPEDRPGIAVDERGRILVIYAAAGKWPWTVHFSVSEDGGHRFSPPQPLSHTAPGKTYQATLGTSADTFHLFWHQGMATAEGTPLYWAVIKDPAHPPEGQIVAGHQCECCRIALAFDTAGQPVLLTRFVFPGLLRDHGLIFPATGKSRRVSFDDWHLEACPEHGPSLAIDEGDRLHLAWFTLGRHRKGLYYAHSDDQGRTVSPAMTVGDPKALAGHPDLITQDARVVLVWQEFDGQKTLVKMIQSLDRGENWSSSKVLATSTKATDYPFLLSREKKIYLSWNTEDIYLLIPIP